MRRWVKWQNRKLETIVDKTIKLNEIQPNDSVRFAKLNLIGNVYYSQQDDDSIVLNFYHQHLSHQCEIVWITWLRQLKSTSLNIANEKLGYAVSRPIT